MILRAGHINQIAGRSPDGVEPGQVHPPDRGSFVDVGQEIFGIHVNHLAGAQIKTENFAGKVHHKYAVIDVEGSDPVVILGSYNWTASGAYDNDENTLIVHDRELARAYHAEWQRMWDALGSERLCQVERVYLPVVSKE